MICRNLNVFWKSSEVIERNLLTPDADAFARWLQAAFDESVFRAQHKDTLSALRELQQAGALLLTTNYDSLLSDTTDLPPVTWEQHAEFLKTMTRQQSGILHIHGHWKLPSSVVLGKSSYDRIARDSIKCPFGFVEILRIRPDGSPLIEWEGSDATCPICCCLCPFLLQPCFGRSPDRSQLWGRGDAVCGALCAVASNRRTNRYRRPLLFGLHSCPKHNPA
jgi:hypothetical protein